MSDALSPVDVENYPESVHIVPCCVTLCTAKAGSNGSTTVVYASKLNRDGSIEGDPFRLSTPNGLYIWKNDEITSEGIRFGSILECVESSSNKFTFAKNTRVRKNIDQIQMDLDYDVNAYRAITEACPDAKINETKKMIYLDNQPDSPKIILVSLKYGVIKDERIIFVTKGGEHLNLKLNCRENLVLQTSCVYLQMSPLMNKEDVGDVAVIKFGTSPCGSPSNPIFPAVCEGLILKYKPKVISIDEEPVKIKNADKKFIQVPGMVTLDTGNDAATGISRKLLEKLNLEDKIDYSKKRKFMVAGGSSIECNRVHITLKIRDMKFPTNALVGALAPKTDLLIGMEIISKLNDENFTLG